MRAHRPRTRAATLVLLALVAACLCTVVSWGQEDAAQPVQLRAFYSAPPAIPHEVLDQQDSSMCLACHEEIMDFGDDGISVPTPHPTFGNCQQCHVQTQAPPWMEPPVAESSFEGLKAPEPAPPVEDGTPPIIPHRIFMRGACIACHAPDHPREERRPPHEVRQNCQQCHVADPANEFRRLLSRD